MVDESFVTNEKLKELDAKAKEASDKASNVDKKYRVKQIEIRKRVIKNIPNEISQLEFEKEKLRTEYNSKRAELSKKIKLIRSSKRKITKKAYLEDNELQVLKQEKEGAWSTVHKLYGEFNDLYKEEYDKWVKENKKNDKKKME